MKTTLTLFTAILFFCFNTNAQKIDWDSSYKIQLSDFHSRGTQIGDVRQIMLNSAIGFDFSVVMSNYEFMFTKNFNDKVSNTFNQSHAAIIAQDSAQALQMIALAQYEFDLSELYARKVRQKLFEEKNAFSNFSFFQPVFQQMQQEFSERRTEAINITQFGKDDFKLYGLHKEVLDEINALSEYCKECKPKKRKKK